MPNPQHNRTVSSHMSVCTAPWVGILVTKPCAQSIVNQTSFPFCAGSRAPPWISASRSCPLDYERPAGLQGLAPSKVHAVPKLISKSFIGTEAVGWRFSGRSIPPCSICILNYQGQHCLQRERIKMLSSFNVILLLHRDGLKRDERDPNKNGNKLYLCGCYVLAFFSQFGP